MLIQHDWAHGSIDFEGFVAILGLEVERTDQGTVSRPKKDS